MADKSKDKKETAEDTKVVRKAEKVMEYAGLSEMQLAHLKRMDKADGVED